MTFDEYRKEHEAFKWALNFIADSDTENESEAHTELKFAVEVAKKALAGELTLDE